MKIQTEAFLLGVTEIHSSKTNKDFLKFSFVLEGDCVNFFTSKSYGEPFTKKKCFAELAKTHAPQKCVIVVELRFTEKGIFADLREVE